MSAIGFLCLILFIIGLCLAAYYAYICYDVPSSRTHKILHSEDGPFLKYSNDFNGNESVAIPLERIDEPDIIQPSMDKGDDITEAPSPSAPECSSKGKVVRHNEIEHVQLERAIRNETRVLLDIVPLRPLPNSDEEDGLVFSKEFGISAASILASGRLSQSCNVDKHVHFPYIDTADEDINEGTSCDPPITTRGNIDVRIFSHSAYNCMDKITDGKCREPSIICEVKEGHHNPIHDIKVKVVLPSSTQSSCEELRTRSSDTDTSDPDVTEYSFTTGSKIPSTSEILADEISSCVEPEITKITVLNESLPNNDISSSKRVSIDSVNNMLLPSGDRLSINTPPNTPPEGIQKDITFISNISAKKYSAKSVQNPSFIVQNNFRSSSVSSSSSLSSDELYDTNTTASASLLKK